jgi:hypothetical protein
MIIYDRNGQSHDYEKNLARELLQTGAYTTEPPALEKESGEKEQAERKKK